MASGVAATGKLLPANGTEPLAGYQSKGSERDSPFAPEPLVLLKMNGPYMCFGMLFCFKRISVTSFASKKTGLIDLLDELIEFPFILCGLRNFGVFMLPNAFIRDLGCSKSRKYFEQNNFKITH